MPTKTIAPHSIPTDQRSTDGNHIVTGPMTLQGLAKTPFWKSLSIDDRVTLMQKSGYSSAFRKGESDTDFDIRLHKDDNENKRLLGEASGNRFFILADYDAAKTEKKEQRLFIGKIVEPNRKGGLIGREFSDKNDANASIIIDKTLNISNLKAMTTLNPQILRDPITLNRKNDGIVIEPWSGNVTINKSAVDKMVKAHNSGELVQNEQKNPSADAIAQSFEQFKAGYAPTSLEQTPGNLGLPMKRDPQQLG